MMIKASAMHRSETPEAQGHLTDLLIRTLDRILDEIEFDGPKG
jgi:hypothetical protein